MKSLIKENSQLPFKSITFNNGLEFTKAEKLADIGIKVYFAFPYSSWQRGRNENWNGILRRWFPKSTDFLRATDQELASANFRINKMPCEILDWKSSKELLNELTQKEC